MRDVLAAGVDVSANLQIDLETALSGVVAGFVGRGLEIVDRHRGRPVPVAPLLHLQRGLWAWLGYREEWQAENLSRGTRRFSFRSIALTIHFGWKNDAFKPQMFRAEWPGWSEWGAGYSSFQAANAGHRTGNSMRLRALLIQP
jgi:hypothetical protein